MQLMQCNIKDRKVAKAATLSYKRADFNLHQLIQITIIQSQNEHILLCDRIINYIPQRTIPLTVTARTRQDNGNDIAPHSEHHLQILIKYKFVFFGFYLVNGSRIVEFYNPLYNNKKSFRNINAPLVQNFKRLHIYKEVLNW